MCGFAGAIPLGAGAAPAPPLSRALERLAARGPDAQWVGRHGVAALAATRLAIVDRTAASDPPLLDPSGEVCLLYNGELYDAERVRGELRARGRAFRSAGDGEVVLAAYLEHGESFLRAIDGMFALAIVDRRNGGKVLLARDPFGEKPLLYARTAAGLAFASTMAALRPLLDRPEVDPDVLAATVRHGFALGGATAMRGVRRVPPGTAIVFEGGVERVLAFVGRASAVQETGEALDALAARFRELLRASVRRRARSEVGVGVFLSGGLDSAAIAAALAEEGIVARALTAGFRGEDDERPRARATARALGVPWIEVELGPDLLESWGPLTAEIGEPLADASILNLHALARRARERVGVVLAGEGGDELFGGYRRERAYAAIGSLRLPAAVSAGLAALPGEAGRVGRALRRPRGMERYRELRDRTSEGEELLLSEYRGARVEADPAHATTARDEDLGSYLPDDLLFRLDAATAAASIEARAPFLDPDLAAFGRTLPRSARHGLGSGKRVIRRALEGRVPDEVVRGRKRGFGAPLARWLRETDFAARVLEDPRALEPPLDRAKVRAALEDHRRGRRDRSLVLARAIAVELFRRTFA
ncbi:MAG TPA: asparagine synthase (glutamine-hydrolyzing) [Planctomycetota bacterium]|nr:asparagine synthase (glutamine-hydrolyzing) [Planctomycetota bacterium]